MTKADMLDDDLREGTVRVGSSFDGGFFRERPLDGADLFDRGTGMQLLGFRPSLRF